MELEDALKGRRSIRRYSDRPVSKEQIQSLVEAALLAPSALNAQPWHFTVVAGQMRDRVVEAISKSTVYLADVLATFDEEHRAIAEQFVCDLGGAPVVVVVSVPQEEEEYTRLTTLLAVGGAVQNLQLAAYEAGLASCNITFAFWVRDELAALLDLEEREIVSVILIGHPDETPQMPPREHDVATLLGFDT